MLTKDNKGGLISSILRSDMDASIVHEMFLALRLSYVQEHKNVICTNLFTMAKYVYCITNKPLSHGCLSKRIRSWVQPLKSFDHLLKINKSINQSIWISYTFWYIKGKEKYTMHIEYVV